MRPLAASNTLTRVSAADCRHKLDHIINIVEQDYSFIRQVMRPMLYFKVFRSAAATLAGIEITQMIRKGQLGQNGGSPFKQFATLAA